MERQRQSLQSARRNEAQALEAQKHYEAGRSATEAKAVEALWTRWQTAAERQISTAQDRAIVVSVYRRSWLRKRLNLAAKHYEAAAWPLWQEEIHNPDSRSLPPVYFLLADGNLAAGSKRSASIIRPGDGHSRQSQFRKVLERCVEELEQQSY